jgi:hypothetical protein
MEYSCLVSEIPTFIFTSSAFIILYLFPSSKLPTRGTHSSSPFPPLDPSHPHPSPNYSPSLSNPPRHLVTIALAPSAGRSGNRRPRRQIEQATGGTATEPSSLLTLVVDLPLHGQADLQQRLMRTSQPYVTQMPLLHRILHKMMHQLHKKKCTLDQSPKVVQRNYNKR